MTRLSACLALSLLVAACAPKAQAPADASLSAAELDSVKAVDAAWAAGMNARDTAAVLAVYADDARLMPPDSPALQGDGIRGVIAGLIAGGASDFALTSSVAYGVGDLAYVVGTATFMMGGAPDTVKYTEVLRKGADGKWRYVVDMFSGVSAPAPAAAPAK